MSDKSKGKGLLRGNIGIMTLTSGLWTLGGNLAGPFFSLYVLALGGDYVDIGLIAALRAVVGIVPHFLGGYLADSIGRKRLLYTMSFLLSLNQLLYAFAPSYRVLLLVAALDAFWGGFREPSFFALVADSTRPESRALAYAMWQIIPPFFGFFSPYIGGVLIDNYGMLVAMRWAYVAAFVTSLVASFIRYRYLEETLLLESGRRPGFREAVGGTFSDLKVTFKALPRALWKVFVFNFILNFAHSLCGPYFVTYAMDGAGLTAAQWGLISTAQTLINTAVRIPAAWGSDRYGRLKFILPSVFLLPVTYFLFTNSTSFYEVAVVLMANSAFESLQGPSSQALLIDLSPRTHRGRINAILTVPNALIGSGANILGGELYQGVSIRMPFFASSALLLAGAVFTLAAVREPKKREE